MGKRESAPEVNAGSMADIAFLLLIFFLVTTTIETDVGLERMLPRENGEAIEYQERNVLSVLLDAEGNLLVDNELIEPELLRKKAIDFIDNGGGQETASFCDYCRGQRKANSSDNPKKAVFALSTQRETAYGSYIAVQNELVAAYNVLRNREANRLFKMSYTQLDSLYRSSEISKAKKSMLGTKIKTIQNMYPMNISEVELKNQ